MSLFPKKVEYPFKIVLYGSGWEVLRFLSVCKPSIFTLQFYICCWLCCL